MHRNTYPSYSDLKFTISFHWHLEILFNKTAIMALTLKSKVNTDFFFIAPKIKYLSVIWLPPPIHGYNIA